MAVFYLNPPDIPFVALEVMLERGVMHRDISRDNVLCHPVHHDVDKGVGEVATRTYPYIDRLL